MSPAMYLDKISAVFPSSSTESYILGGMEIFSGEGLDLNFSLGEFSDLERGQGGEAKLRDFSCADVDIYNDIGINEKMLQK